MAELQALKQFESLRFDWSRTPLFIQCIGYQRHVRPPLDSSQDHIERQIMTNLTNMR